MAKVTHNGKPVNTNGELPAKGSQAPNFHLVDASLNDVYLETYKGKKKLINIVVSLDTGICERSAKTLAEVAPRHTDTVFLTVSADLPFAQARACKPGTAPNAFTLSMMRSRNFAKDYGVLLTDGVLAGVCSRAVVVLDVNDKVLYTQLVPEIASDPNLDAAIAALK
ncbi:MAG: thiol peroxidase [Gammaproteobacteria bacterium]|nr:thiol peroxidase [Gammaproteobacteria bacterium]